MEAPPLTVNRSTVVDRSEEPAIRRFGDRHQWYGAYVFLNVLDLAMTCYILHFGGEENNPVGNYILSHIGWQTFISFKFLLCVVVLLVVEAVYRRREAAGRLLLTLACTVYLLLMGWDVYLLLRFKGYV